ncbi:MAG: hypothetical protein KBS44_01380 [Clostridiales bacterium]|nr:hypothetical protein [Candidatus Coliplasma equi]
MSIKDSERVMLVLSIISRGDGKAWIKELKKSHIHCHMQFAGRGTASSEMMNVLGLESSDKDLILSFGSQSAIKDITDRMLNGFRSVTHGILMTFSPNAINHLVEVFASRSNHYDLPEEETEMKNGYEYSLILVAVNAGYTDDVMTAAKKAGATGGTVIRARLVDSERAENRYGLILQDEREIVSIMTSANKRDAIMEAINDGFGIRTPAQAIICSVPVEKAFKM